MAQQPGQRHFGQGLAAGGGDLIQRADLCDFLRRDVLLLQKTPVGVYAAVGRDAVQVAVRQQALRQRAEGDDALVQLRGGLFQPIVFHRAVENRIAVLVDDERHVQLVQNGRCLFQCRAVVVGQAHIQRFAAAHGLCQRTHCLFQRGVGVHAVVVENIHIVQPHAAQALVKAGQQVLAAAPVAVGAVPHLEPGFGGDDQLVAVDAEVVPQNFTEIPLGRARLGAVVVGKVKVGDAIVKRRAAERAHIFVGCRVAKIMPQPQRDGGQQQATIAAAAVGQDTVTVLGCLIHGKNPLLYSYYKSRKTDTQWQRCTKNCVKICRLDINPISDYNKNPKSDFEKRRPMQEKQRQVYDLLEITNRQFNECNALYHAVAQRYGLSDAAFWVLYALCTTHEPQTQNRMAAEWGQPKQTLNSAVAAMVKKGLVELCPGNGAHSGKIVTLTDEGRALAARTVEPVIAAEQQAMTHQGLAEVEQNCRLTQRYLECLRQEFEKIAR